MNNLSYLAKIIKVEGNRLTLELKDELNIARLKQSLMDMTARDKRKYSSKTHEGSQSNRDASHSL